MTRRIEGVIYKITYTALWHDFIECSSKEDLFKYIANEIINGQIVTSVNEICKDGSTPKVKVHTDKEFKRILKQYQNPKKHTNVENLKIEIETIGNILYSDLSDYEKETIKEQIKDGYTYGEFYTISDRTDEQVLLKWSI